MVKILIKMNELQSSELQSLLRLVSLDRISNDNEWISTISMLSYNNKLYEDLLYCITNRMHKIDNIEQITIGNIDHNEYHQLSCLAIEYWANIDNPSKYKKMKYDSIITMIRCDIYDSILLGDLQQFHFAKYLKMRFKYKYVTDFTMKSCIWHELAIIDTNTVVNSTFNWNLLDDKYQLISYLTNDITMMLKELQSGLEQRLLDEIDKTVKSLLIPIKINIKKTIKRLQNKIFCNQVLSEFGFMIKRN